MRKVLFVFFFISSFLLFSNNVTSSIYIDSEGIMRWSSNNEEAVFFGVNYTIPFAHAYRMAGALGADRKKAIDKDVYHFSRLGFNAYRIHIWDVEISDEEGNLIINDHLDLLDYLIYKLKERNIKIVITAMTNFGNGYPEKNTPTSGFSYLYDKHRVHQDAEAIEAQKNYITQLVTHVNPYTSISYQEDLDIIGFEINNEPNHGDNIEMTLKYLNDMLGALESTGNQKPIFYNVSHDWNHIDAYYKSDINGTTYQWYPIGLVANHSRKGNFLPYVDNYDISFKEKERFKEKAKLIYEYDPADSGSSYLHPAIVRSLRSAGFQWITQFAYDPIDIARYNTEYQTHFLNLAYTPRKAISMKIASEVAYTTHRNKFYGSYPNNTQFDGFRVSYEEDLSELNISDKFYYSNNTNAVPIDAKKLKNIAGYGSSSIIKYEGFGAYFLDKLEDGVWRLEIMPDAVEMSDPYKKASTKKEVVSIFHNPWNMVINLPDLGEQFQVSGINEGNTYSFSTNQGVIVGVMPGVYILKNYKATSNLKWGADSLWNGFRLNEYVAPQAHAIKPLAVNHKPNEVIERENYIELTAIVAGEVIPDSVVVYTDNISFWSDNNTSYKMKVESIYEYKCIIPAEELHGSKLRYNIVVHYGNNVKTFPSGIEGMPLDWDYTDYTYYETRIVDKDSPIVLFSSHNDMQGMELYTIPEGGKLKQYINNTKPPFEDRVKFVFSEMNDGSVCYLRKFIGNIIINREKRLKNTSILQLNLEGTISNVNVGFITKNGFTYTYTFSAKEGINSVDLADLIQSNTALLPHAYPVFLDKYFEPDIDMPFSIEDIEFLEIYFEPDSNIAKIEVGSVWLE